MMNNLLSELAEVLEQRKREAPDASYVASLSDEDREIIRLVPDRALPAEALVTLTRDLRAAGAQKVMLVTQRALQ